MRSLTGIMASGDDGFTPVVTIPDSTVLDAAFDPNFLLVWDSRALSTMRSTNGLPVTKPNDVVLQWEPTQNPTTEVTWSNLTSSTSKARLGVIGGKQAIVSPTGHGFCLPGTFQFSNRCLFVVCSFPSFPAMHTVVLAKNLAAEDPCTRPRNPFVGRVASGGVHVLSLPALKHT